MSGLVDSDFFPVIQPYIKIENYLREGGGSGNPRHRIEVHRHIPPAIRRQALEFEMPCVACGASIHPFRPRDKNGHLYYAPCCPLDRKLACSRGKAASDEYRRVVAACANGHGSQGALL